MFMKITDTNVFDLETATK
jgi:mannose-6-phosphate isomerase-like protein (cupin superfamily)